MADRVGFARNISEEYLNAVADCKLADKSLLETRDILNELIGSRIHAETNIKNTRVILLNTWYRNDSWLQDRCIEIAKEPLINHRYFNTIDKSVRENSLSRAFSGFGFPVIRS